MLIDRQNDGNSLYFLRFCELFLQINVYMRTTTEVCERVSFVSKLYHIRGDNQYVDWMLKHFLHYMHFKR